MTVESCKSLIIRFSLVAHAALAASLITPTIRAEDSLREMQDKQISTKDQKYARPYHFGSQGPGDVFSNHASHSNRLIPVYVFGKKADLGAIMGPNSRYRDAERIRVLYGRVPENTVNPQAEYADQSDLYRVQRDAIERGVKHVFTVWFDGLDWQTTQAAAVARTGHIYQEGKGTGLVFQADRPRAPLQFGYVVTSPTHDKNAPDLDAQTVTIPKTSLGGGYDVRIAGPNPWTLGHLLAPGYLKGQSANGPDKTGVAAVGGVLHAYTDSSQSAGEYATGIKSYNNGVNVTDDGRFVPTLFGQLQAQGWKVGTVTSVPFDHVSPAAMYAHNVHRDDYQDLARDMLGLPGIVQETGKDPQHPGLDVIIGAGHGQAISKEALKAQGKNGVGNDNMFIAAADLAAIDVKNGGKYEVAQTTKGQNGASGLMAAAERAAKDGHRLFGFYGSNTNHLPFRTADGGYNPARGIKGTAEKYSQADLEENPTLADMTRAALTVMAADPNRPFALFVEAGDVDFALHDNNLDNAIGAIYSGEDAVKTIIDWVESHGGWEENMLVVTADHGHYLVVDQLEAIAGAQSHAAHAAASR